MEETALTVLYLSPLAFVMSSGVLFSFKWWSGKVSLEKDSFKPS